MTNEFNEELQKARSAIYNMSGLQKQYNQQDDLLKKQSNKYNTEKRCSLGAIGWIIVSLGTFFGCIPLATVIYAITESELNSRNILLTFLFSVVFLFIFLFTLIKIIKHIIFSARKNNVYKKQADVITTSMKSINQSIIEFYNTGYKPALIIPPKYRYPLAIEYIIECFENNRADNMRDAVNLYEQQVHNWRVENYLDQIKLMQWQQRIALQNLEYISKITASAAAVSAINSFR